MIELDMIVEDERWRAVPDLEAHCRRAFDAGLMARASEGVVSLLLADDEALRQLNATFRGKDTPTDVLSFPADEMDRPLLGDIAVAYDTSLHDASAQAKTLADHLTHLLIHGYLHLLGHDHETSAEACVMEALEIKALASLGIANPYLVD